MTILYATLLLGGLGLLFGGILSFASKKFHVDVDERVAQVRECLGGANCGACGYAGCDAFAAAVVAGEAPVNGCGPAGEKGVKEISRIMGMEAPATEKMVARVLCQGECGVAKERYQYDGYVSCALAATMAGGPKDCRFSCIGLGDCVKKCQFDAITLANGIAHINPDRCTACGACAAACPRGVIKLMPLSQTVLVRCHNGDSAKLARMVCSNACIGCGRCKKTCQHDAITIVDGFAHIDPAKCVRCGECAAVCPSKCITLEGAPAEGTPAA